MTNGAQQHSGLNLLPPEKRQWSFDIEDNRWAAKEQLRDWLIVAAIFVLDLSFAVLIYFLQPGLGAP